MTAVPPDSSVARPAEPHQSPPRAALAFRVGIVGHRPNRLERADLLLLAERLHHILAAVRAEVGVFQATHPEFCAPNEPILRAVTPLAEGADRIFAEQALALGFALCCPLPFHREEYEKDFLPPKAMEPDSLARFHGLLDQARAGAGLVLFEMDGERSHSGAAYGAAGQVVLNQSDLLIAVWDGGEPAGKGGTADTLRDAIHDRIPVLVIDACAPHGWVLVRTQSQLAQVAGCSESSSGARSGAADWDALRALVSEILVCPRTIRMLAQRTMPRGARAGAGAISESVSRAGTSPLPGGYFASCMVFTGCGCRRCEYPIFSRRSFTIGRRRRV